MNLTECKQKARQETGVSRYFPITHLCTPAVFETNSGMLGMVLKIEGIPFITATNDELNQAQRLLHQALLKIDYSFVLYETRIRRKKDTSLSGSFDNSFAKRVNDKYHRRFQTSSLYVNEIYWTLLYKNEDASYGKERVLDKVLRLGRRMSDGHMAEALTAKREKGLQRLSQKVAELQSLLSSFGIRILGEQDNALGYSELLGFLSLIPNGGQHIALDQNIHPVPISKNLIDIADDLKRYPQGNLGQYLCNHRLFFGNAIQFQGNTASDMRFAAMLSLKQYGKDTASVILDPLMNLEGEAVLTQSFAPLERELAIKAIERAYGMKINAEDMAASQLEQLGELADMVAGESLQCGLHHNTLMLLSESPEMLDALIHQASSAYSLANMSLVRETLAQQPAFFSQIPGNGHCIPRSALITSENFADFCSLHNTQTGHHQENFLSSAITLLETPAKTPVFFNYHVKGSKTNPSKGHTLVIGGNDSGKTTLVSFLDAQMARFPKHRAVFLDRNNGLKIYIQAMCGTYTTIAPTHKEQCRMNPLALDDTPFNRDFCKHWLKALLLNEEETGLSSSITELCNDAVDYCFEDLSPTNRSLSNLARFLPIDFPRWAELRRWLKGSDSTTEGQYAWVFDNKSDAITLQSKRIGFDVTYVLDNMPPAIATPLFMYIMHRIELCLDGNLTSIVVDEMWQVLRTAYWQGWLAERLPSVRKDYGHIIGMTQSPKTIVQSPISAELLDNVATMILFPNPKAEASVYIERLGLSVAEFEFIKNNSPNSRLFLYKHDTDSMICKLDLSHLSDEVRVFSANKSSVQLMETLMNEKGEDPVQWLEPFIERSKA